MKIKGVAVKAKHERLHLPVMSVFFWGHYTFFSLQALLFPQTYTEK